MQYRFDDSMKFIYLIELTLYCYLKIKHDLLRYKRDLVTIASIAKVAKGRAQLPEGTA
jgi:hypothetical protein